MSRRERQRLADVLTAIDAIHDHLRQGDLERPVVFDAVRMRLIEIGEAVEAVPDDIKHLEGDIPWRLIAGMRDNLTHRYFVREIDIVRFTVQDDLGPLRNAVVRLLAHPRLAADDEA